MIPLTMFKVFRRRRLVGVHLPSNGSDLDIGLVIKLTRNGSILIEVPVAARCGWVLGPL